MARGFEAATGIPWGRMSGYTSYTPHPFEIGVAGDRALRRGYGLTGGVPSRVRVHVDGDLGALAASLEDHARGVLDLGA